MPQIQARALCLLPRFQRSCHPSLRRNLSTDFPIFSSSAYLDAHSRKILTGCRISQRTARKSLAALRFPLFCSLFSAYYTTLFLFFFSIIILLFYYYSKTT